MKQLEKNYNTGNKKKNLFSLFIIRRLKMGLNVRFSFCVGNMVGSREIDRYIDR